MFARAILLALAASPFITSVLAQYEPPCTPGQPGANSLQCKVCGNPNSSGITCIAYNATFDDLKAPSTIGTYNAAGYSSLTTVQRNKANPIFPASPYHYARSITGQAKLDFTSSPGGLGELHTFDYACADPCTKTTSDKPIPCTLTITAGAVNTTGNSQGQAYYYSGTFDYTPTAGARYANMAAGDFTSAAQNADPPSSSEVLTYFVYNYTFSAVKTDGSPAFLYLDNLVYNTWVING